MHRFVEMSHSVNGNRSRVLFSVTCLFGIVACNGCASARRVSLSAEDTQTVAALREKFSAGVVDPLLATGDYTRSGKLNAEALAHDAQEVRDTKVQAIAERAAQQAAAAKEGPSVIESSVDGEFNGFDGDTVVRLMDGSIWEQAEFYWEWHWAYIPKVIVYRSQGGWKMQVEGIDKSVRVRRLK